MGCWALGWWWWGFGCPWEEGYNLNRPNLSAYELSDFCSTITWWLLRSWHNIYTSNILWLLSMPPQSTRFFFLPLFCFSRIYMCLIKAKGEKERKKEKEPYSRSYQRVTCCRKIKIKIKILSSLYIYIFLIIKLFVYLG